MPVPAQRTPQRHTHTTIRPQPSGLAATGETRRRGGGVGDALARCGRALVKGTAPEKPSRHCWRRRCRRRTDPILCRGITRLACLSKDAGPAHALTPSLLPQHRTHGPPALHSCSARPVETHGGSSSWSARKPVVQTQASERGANSRAKGQREEPARTAQIRTQWPAVVTPRH